jgi:hypothetical protein
MSSDQHLHRALPFIAPADSAQLCSVDGRVALDQPQQRCAQACRIVWCER